MTHTEQALACFNQGFNCSQSVFVAFAEEFGLDREQALRVAAAFGGGIARTGGMCGALNGALMALGLKYGMTSVEHREAKEQTYGIAQEFVRRFAEANGVVTCRELLGHDISTPEGRQEIKELDLHNRVCNDLVIRTVELLEATLAE
jgi:C_GCAxxG_C_C family probable redox protein